MGRSDVIEEPLPIGFSPCPNDTFMFGPMVRTPGFVPGVKPLPWLADIEALNERALAGEAPLAFTKLSAHGYFWAEERYMALRTGAALGRGCGPLVVARAPSEIEGLRGKRVAVPGAYTTAHLLLRCLAPAVVAVQIRFDRIMPAVAAGEVDAGVIIHEGRFVYPTHGLVMVADLGAIWEAATGLPLPLGVIAAERSLPIGQVRAVEDAIARSIAAAEADPAAVWSYVKGHAQELSDEVCRRHIALYVNEFSRDLGAEGAAAIEELRRRGREVGALPR